MNKKTIDRNDILLSGEFEERFGELTVMKGDGGFVIAAPCEDEMVRWFHIDRSDAERFAQAVLVHSETAVVK